MVKKRLPSPETAGRWSRRYSVNVAPADRRLSAEANLPTFDLFHLTGDSAMRPLSTVTVTLTLLLASLTLAACNTMRGVGEDVQSGGEVIEGTANRAQGQ
jgi:entericidin B